MVLVSAVVLGQLFPVAFFGEMAILDPWEGHNPGKWTRLLPLVPCVAGGGCVPGPRSAALLGTPGTAGATGAT
jgi:hypothetical protein